MTTDPVELLERAISYTRATLIQVSDDDLSRGTPCAAWNLASLLEHMTDSLDALTEASRGLVTVSDASIPGGVGVPGLCARASNLLGAWANPAARSVRLGERELESTRLLRAGAVEITVHGWDVARSTGRGPEIPEALATDLLPPAYALVDARDRGVRFARAVPPRPGESDASRLLGHLGRRAGIAQRPA